jgi:ATP-binding cassette subfamily B protein
VLAPESLGLGRVPGALLAVADLAMALPLLAAGAAPRAEVALGGGWAALVASGAAAYLGAHRRSATSQLGLTHRLVEQLAGHRTRLVQEAPNRRREPEERELAAHDALCRLLDRRTALLRTALPGAWLPAAFALLFAAGGGGASPARLAAFLGGTLLAHRARGELAAATLDLAEAEAAARQLRPLFRRGSGRRGRRWGEGECGERGQVSRLLRECPPSPARWPPHSRAERS